MLNTDGYVYLRVDEPLCAWNTYRAVLVSADVLAKQPGCLSVWCAATIRPGFRTSRVERECNLEKVRRERYGDKVSRSWGIYVFRDKDSANRARIEMAQPFMTLENLAEVSLAEARNSSIHDSNWITYHSDDVDLKWIDAYWSGVACPGHVPLYESLISGRVVVLGTELREMAYKKIKSRLPESLSLLETARIAAWVGSDLGTIAAFIVSKNKEYAIDYYINMEDADDPTFLKKIEDYMRSGQSVNRNDIDENFKKESFGRVPDFRQFAFAHAKRDLPYLADLL